MKSYAEILQASSSDAFRMTARERDAENPRFPKTGQHGAPASLSPCPQLDQCACAGAVLRTVRHPPTSSARAAAGRFDAYPCRFAASELATSAVEELENFGNPQRIQRRVSITSYHPLSMRLGGPSFRETKYHCLHRGQRHVKRRTSVNKNRIAQRANETRGGTRGTAFSNGAHMGRSSTLR
jgi:hypothetical protein